MSEVLKRILYVEDEPDIQAVTKIALENVGGYIVRICSSGEEALHCAVEFKPDLILLDVMLPGMDGPATLAALREIPQLRDLPAIFMTAKVQPQEIEYLKSLGAIDVIAKPFDPMQLGQDLLDSWTQHHGETASIS